MNRSNFLSLEDRGELLACVKRQREDHGVARRANALLLLDDGKSCVEIAQVLYLDDDTVRGWHKQYVAEGWDAVAYDGWKVIPPFLMGSACRITRPFSVS
tara:strand:- start:254 stop:553 length:300 start_codon:yes stop_codon:yes gene_type:complete